MSQTAQHKMSMADRFRINYTPDPVAEEPCCTANVPVGRHWILDFAAGRDLLKTVLRRKHPSLYVPVIRSGHEFDDTLDAFIDELGLRAMPKPSSHYEEFKAMALFFQLMVLRQFAPRQRV